MRIIHLTYRAFPEAVDPVGWIDSFGFFRGIWEVLAHRHQIVFYEFGNHSTVLEMRGILYRFLKLRGFVLSMPIALHRRIQGERPDVVIVHGLMNPMQVVMLRRQLGRSIKIVVQHHAEQAFRHWLKKAIQRTANRVVDAYFFSGYGLAKPWVDAGLIDKEKVKEIMETSSVFKAQGSNDRENQSTLNYLWVGRLNANKNPLMVVRAFMQFVGDCRLDVVLHMIFQNDDLLEEVTALLATDPVAAKSIRLVGKVPHNELQAWYASAHFIVSGSFYEGSGVAVCEGMSCGCIPILTDIASFRFMTGGRCGLLYEPGKAVALLEALHQSAKLDRKSASAETLKQFHKVLSFEAIATEIEHVLSTL